MKKKLVFAFIGLFIFSICLVSGIHLRDYFYKENLRNNIHKIAVGMSEKEVIEILGKPNHIWMSDEPSVTWCYDTDSISHILEAQPDIECGNMVLQMGYRKNGEKWEYGQVIKIFNLEH